MRVSDYSSGGGCLGGRGDITDKETTLLHNNSFWTTFLNTLHIEMSVGLVVRKGRTRSEVVSPLLRRLAHYVSSMAAPEGWEGGEVYSSLLNVESCTEDRAHTPGPSLEWTTRSLDTPQAGSYTESLLR